MMLVFFTGDRFAGYLWYGAAQPGNVEVPSWP
jgi:hypothetical protein